TRVEHENPVAARAREERACRQHCRWCISAELQLTLSAGALNEHRRTCSLEVQVDSEHSVAHLRIYAPYGEIHGIATESDRRLLTHSNPSQIELVDVSGQLHARLWCHFRQALACTA